MVGLEGRWLASQLRGLKNSQPNVGAAVVLK